MLTPEIITNATQWNATIQTLPYAHILQTWEWGEFKQITTGWTPERVLYYDSNGTVKAGISLLTRRLGIFSVIYAPKGAMLNYDDHPTRDAVLNHLQTLARQRRVIWLKIDPDVPIGTGIPSTDPDPHPKYPAASHPIGESLQSALRGRGWRFSNSQVQFRNTLTLDLSQSEDELLADMSQSTRRKIRKADKAGVQVRPATTPADLETLYQIYTQTGKRQGFVTRPLPYYKRAWGTFLDANLGTAFIAELDQQAIAGLVLFKFGAKTWYFYGMSSNQERDAQPNYALQWAAIRWAKSQGSARYDWWGAPNDFNEDDPMWGVYRFKSGFGGQVVRHIGAWDYIPHPFLYNLYEKIMPSVLNFWRHKSETE